MGVREIVGVTDGEVEIVGVMVGVDDSDMVAVLVDDTEMDDVLLAVTEMDDVLLAVTEMDEVLLRVTEMLDVLDGVTDLAAVLDAVGVVLGVEVTLAVTEMVGVRVDDTEMEGVMDGVMEIVGVRVGVMEMVGVMVRLLVGVTVPFFSTRARPFSRSTASRHHGPEARVSADGASLDGDGKCTSCKRGGSGRVLSAKSMGRADADDVATSTGSPQHCGAEWGAPPRPTLPIHNGSSEEMRPAGSAKLPRRNADAGATKGGQNRNAHTPEQQPEADVQRQHSARALFLPNNTTRASCAATSAHGRIARRVG